MNLQFSKFNPLRGDTIVLSKFCGIPAAKRAKLSRSSTNARARGEEALVGQFSLVRIDDKMQVKKREPKYPVMSKAITEFVLEGWYTGAPVTRHGCYQKAMELCEIDGLFYKQHIDPKKI